MKSRILYLKALDAAFECQEHSEAVHNDGPDLEPVTRTA